MLVQWQRIWIIVRMVAALIIPPVCAQADMTLLAHNQNIALKPEVINEQQTVETSRADIENHALRSRVWLDTPFSDAIDRHMPHRAHENALTGAFMRMLQDRLRQAAFIFQAILGEISPMPEGYQTFDKGEIILGLGAQNSSSIPGFEYCAQGLGNSGDGTAFFFGLTIMLGR